MHFYPGDRALIHIVAGHPRSGTSMMMRALIKGGMDAVWRKSRETKLVNHKIYELAPEDYEHHDFPRMHEGKLLKCMGPRIQALCPGDYKAVFMKRSFWSVKASFEKVFGAEFPWDEESYDTWMANIEGVARLRRDMDVISFEYETVLKHPRKCLGILENRGWPFNLDKAVEVVDPNMRSF